MRELDRIGGLLLMAVLASGPPTAAQQNQNQGNQPSGVVQARPTPDIAPNVIATPTVHIITTSSSMDPSIIVAEPGQRINILLDNQGTATNNLVFRTSQSVGPVFAMDVPGGQQQRTAITAPNVAGRYTFYAIAGSSKRRGLSGTLIVTPRASGSATSQYGARDIRIVALDDRFNPDSPFAMPGERIRLTLVNGGDMPHNIVIQMPGSQTATFRSNLGRGEMRTIQFTMPRQTGRFTFYDPVSGNRDRGLNGTLIVARVANGNTARAHRGR